MNKRNEYAAICQGGASNARRVASCLVEAIDECWAENVDPKQDPAVFLITHQLVWLITGHDLAVGDERLSALWAEADKVINQVGMT